MKTALDLVAYPNPATDHVMVSIESEKLIPARIWLLDMNGRKVRDLKINLFTGKQEVRIDLSNLETGMYILQLIARNRSDSSKLLNSSKLIKS